MPMRLRHFAGTLALVAALGAPHASSAQPSSFVIQGDYKIGNYAVKANGTLDGAIEAFGQPTSLRRGRDSGRLSWNACVARWREIGLRISSTTLVVRIRVVLSTATSVVSVAIRASSVAQKRLD
jgi:hypothetical protein